jgi:hypothetical protein
VQISLPLTYKRDACTAAFFSEQRKDSYGIDIAACPDPSYRRRIAQMAPQPQLGLRPQRRPGTDIARRRHPHAHGTAVTSLANEGETMKPSPDQAATQAANKAADERTRAANKAADERAKAANKAADEATAAANKAKDKATNLTNTAADARARAANKTLDEHNHPTTDQK